MRFLRQNSLSIAFGIACVATLAGQSVAGLHKLNEDAREHGEMAISWGRYLLSSDFGVAVLENWQSEFLQFSLYILATVWLLQRGSAESKKLDDAGLGSDREQALGKHVRPNSPRWAKAGGLRTAIYSNSLMILMSLIFFASWGGQAVTGWRTYNDQQTEHKQPEVRFGTYLGRADFWERSLQNWQSELLAVGSMAVFSIYLRQRGSAESKPVGASHDETGSSV